MPSYTKKNHVDMAYDTNKKRLRAEGAVILAEVMNEAFAEMTEQFNEALGRGEILEIGGSRDELKKLLLSAANRQLGDADVVMLDAS